MLRRQVLHPYKMYRNDGRIMNDVGPNVGAIGNLTPPPPPVPDVRKGSGKLFPSSSRRPSHYTSVLDALTN
jgi:hypothetical protein